MKPFQDRVMKKTLADLADLYGATVCESSHREIDKDAHELIGYFVDFAERKVYLDFYDALKNSNQ